MRRLLKFLKFSGRMTPKQFWLAIAVAWMGCFGGMIVLIRILDKAVSKGTLLEPVLVVGVFILLISWIWGTLASLSKRMHDRNTTAAWMFLGCLGLIYFPIAIVYYGSLPGTYGPNSYGPDPREPRVG